MGKTVLSPPFYVFVLILLRLDSLFPNSFLARKAQAGALFEDGERDREEGVHVSFEPTLTIICFFLFSRFQLLQQTDLKTTVSELSHNF